MIPRLKLLAAVLGIVVAAGSIGDASARVIRGPIVKETIITRSAIAPRVRRVIVLPRRPAFHPFVVAYRVPVHRSITHKTIIR